MKYIKIAITVMFTVVGVGGSLGRVNRQDLENTYHGWLWSFRRNISDVHIEIRLDLKKIVLSPKE